VVAYADLVIIPTRPSPHDLRAVGATVDIAERHSKPVIFVINAATARARITGESAVALSQHGVVAPITIHHRVDFAASMIDGRTVCEAVPNSASAREIRNLWVYLQDRLSRAVQDSRLRPDIRPDFAITPLLEVADEIAHEIPPLAAAPEYVGPDRRAPDDRRVKAEPRRGPERRGQVFGRRHNDVTFDGGMK
jgi:hypothetical protein